MLVLRWVDIDLSVNEEFIGLYAVSTIEASSLVFVIKDSLLRLNLTLAKARGKCYDGALEVEMELLNIFKMKNQEHISSTALVIPLIWLQVTLSSGARQ